MITSPKGNDFVHEIIMEYIKQNKILTCNKETLPKQIDHIAEISKIVYDAIEKRYSDFKFL